MSGKVPRRFGPPPIIGSIVFTVALVIIIWSIAESGVSFVELYKGIPWMYEAVSQMIPPDMQDGNQFWRVTNSMLTTLQIAVAGGVIGLIISFAISWLAASNHTPHFTVSILIRSIITLFRSIPDLVWAIFFVMTVGLGPFAGALAIMIDTIGYCGRFYAESMEEVDPAPGESLRSMGAGNLTVIACCTVPSALPGMTAHSLYAMERAVRSSFILGIVGAGGIGQELEFFMTMEQWPYASTCILMIFFSVLGMEQLSNLLRRRLIN